MNKLNETQNLLRISYEDYKLAKSKDSIGRLRDASNKLYAVIQNYIEHKFNIYLGGKDFYQYLLKLPSKRISIQSKKYLYSNLKILHKFFYHGLDKDEDISYYKRIYIESFRILTILILSYYMKYLL